MTIRPDDPRLSAFVLDDHELLSAEDRRAIQSALEQDDVLRAEVDILRESVAGLRAHYAEEESRVLPIKNRQAIVEQRPQPSINLFKVGAVLAAACLMIVPLMFSMVAVGQRSAPMNQMVGDNDYEASRDVAYNRSMANQANSDSPVGLNERALADNGIVQKRLLSKDTGDFVVEVEEMDIEDPVTVEDEQTWRYRRVEKPNQAQQGAALNPAAGVEASGMFGARTNKREEAKATAEAGGSMGFMAIGAAKNKEPMLQTIERGNYNYINDSNFKNMALKGNDFSTFSIDVDTASYSDLRSHIMQHNRLPNPHTVRIEEMINYFEYNYLEPQLNHRHPFNVHIESSSCPWNTNNRLVRIGIQGKRLHKGNRPASNLVFLLDVSGSMNRQNKLPLLKQAFRMLVNQLDKRDQVAIVTYAGSVGLVLAPTSGDQKQLILNALDRLKAGGSTNGAGGIQQAYQVAQRMYQEGAENRVILATDGDFNVGISDQQNLVKFIKEKAETGIFLNIHGYGMSNRKDGNLEMMSNNGNGTYAYIDTISEAKKVMVDDLSGSLVTIAKDVKIQCVFNPRHVAAWRLIGYTNRLMAKEDFKNDKKDAGEIGAGHSVTALYEIVPTGAAIPGADVDPNPFIKEDIVRAQPQHQVNDNPAWFQIRLRYKLPNAAISTAMQHNVIVKHQAYADASESFRWAASVAAFGMRLRQSPTTQYLPWDHLLQMARASKGEDSNGHRAECIRLIEAACHLERK